LIALDESRFGVKSITLRGVDAVPTFRVEESSVGGGM
jgi:hypothetical protein